MISSKKQFRRIIISAAIAAVPIAGLTGTAEVAAVEERVLGIDVSAWQGNISQTTWNNIYNIENRQFVFIRATRGGTTGYDKRQDGFSPGDNSFSLSQRYDDPYFMQNITRATNAGMLAGPYHYSRPDIIASTPNSGGIANTGWDEANHMIEMAGAWMRPGYLLPVFDLEDGQSERTRDQLTQFSLDFSNRIHEVMGIRPVMYINGNYVQYLNGASSSLRNQLPTAFPHLWTARYAFQAPNNDPHDPAVHTAHPKDTFAGFYGPWDTPDHPHPWHVWQYASTGRLQSFNNGGNNLDFNAAHGNIELMKDMLVPALWMHNLSGEWTTLANWNSGQVPTAPPQYPNQSPQQGPVTLPTPRLPGTDDTLRNVSGANDTVILHRPNANITVTHSSGTHNIRKLIVRETLNITGGTLTVNYVPPTSTPPNYLPLDPFSVLVDGAVSLSGSAHLSAHTIQVEPTRTLTLAGGTLSFDTINLRRHSSNPARILVTGNVNINPLGNTTATIASPAATGSSGRIDLAGGNRTFTVADGPADIDLAVNVPITNGALTKAGAGTMRLGVANSYAGQTTINGGILLVTGNTQLGGTGVVTAPAGTLQLSGNVTYALPMTIGGAGANGVSLSAPGSIGALDNLSGTNTWSGAITLAGTGTGGTNAQLNQIGAQAGSLRLSGVIQDAPGISAAWNKTGHGDVILSGTSPNTYTGLTRLAGGRLIIEKDGALGSAGDVASAAGNTFQLAGSASTLAFRTPAGSSGFTYSTFEVINTGGTGAPGLGQVDNLAGNNTFAGIIALDGPSSGGARQASIGVAAGSLHLTGGLYARGNDGNPRHITKLGTGTLILSGDGGSNTPDPLVTPLQNSAFTITAGTVELHGPSATATNLPGVTTWTVNSGATLRAAGGHFATGTVNAPGGSFQLTGGSAAIDTINLTGGGSVSFTTGTLRVNNVLGSLTNQGGTLETGSSAGLTTVTGNYTQQPGGNLAIELGGTTPGTEHDRIEIGGHLSAAGSLTASLIDGFVSLPGQQFEVITFASRGGDFTLIADTGYGGLWYEKQWSANSLTLTAAALAGDANLDGVVNIADLSILAAHWQQSDVTWLEGDFTGEGTVNIADLSILASNWQAEVAGMSLAEAMAMFDTFGGIVIPEPASLSLLVLAVPLALRRRRRRLGRR